MILAGFILLDFKCPFVLLFDVSCPACGMCRAWMSFLTMDIDAAFSYHPLFFLGPVVVLVAVGYDEWKFKRKDWVCTGLGLLFFLGHCLRGRI